MASQHESWNFKEDEEIVPDRYAVHLLGGGPRAEAWLAWDQKMHTIVVIKLLRPNYVDHDRARRGMAREVRNLKRLQHPAIVRMFDSMLNGSRPYIVLESLDGPRISSLLRHYGPLTPEQLVPLGLEVASALAFMHDSGYVHLDVKPRNIILSAMPRLIDLGLARPMVEVRDIAYHVGTDEYMAPEQATIASKLIGPPADVWGLGATLYTCAVGRRPFPSPTDETPYPQIDHEPRQIDPKRVPERISRIVLSCLARDPADRPTAMELAAELEGLLEEARLVAGRRLRARHRR